MRCAVVVVFGYGFVVWGDGVSLAIYIMPLFILIQLTNEVLSFISYIGLGISLTCLFLAIIFFLSFGYV